MQERLFNFVGRASGRLELIPATPAILHAAVTTLIIPDPTDNLILHSILDHATRSGADTKALLTDNVKEFSTPEVEEALEARGINKVFRKAEHVLGWIGSLPR